MQLGPCRAHTRPCGGETLPSASSALAAPPPLPPAPNGERSGEPPTTAAAAAESLRLSRLVFVRSAWRPAQRRAPPADTPPDGGDGGCAGDGSASRPPPARPCESACNSRASTSTADRSPTSAFESALCVMSLRYARATPPAAERALGRRMSATMPARPCGIAVGLPGNDCSGEAVPKSPADPHSCPPGEADPLAGGEKLVCRSVASSRLSVLARLRR
mmetsp:Transcript_17040/g.51092  ORF Transcript_17040/g.51092 Transcript_17040/m.51092 type:complete len:218 (-) Transcript_17040:629-1282(-)